MLPHGERTHLARDFKVSTRTVYSALEYRSDSTLARMLRKAALERGGRETSGQKRATDTSVSIAD